MRHLSLYVFPVVDGQYLAEARVEKRGTRSDVRMGPRSLVSQTSRLSICARSRQ